jgi:hypothetical protein
MHTFDFRVCPAYLTEKIDADVLVTLRLAMSGMGLAGHGNLYAIYEKIVAYPVDDAEQVDVTLVVVARIV